MDWLSLFAFLGIYILAVGLFYYHWRASRRMMQLQRTMVELQALLLEKMIGVEEEKGKR